MFGKVINSEIHEKRIDHYLKLRIDNSEIVKLLKDANAPNEAIQELIPDLENCCLITKSYRYTDRYGVYWDNWSE